MGIRHRRLVERQLRRDTEFKVVVHEGEAGRDPDLRKGLPRRPGDQLVVVELDVGVQVTQRPRQADVVHVIAQIRQRIFDHIVGE